MRDWLSESVYLQKVASNTLTRARDGNISSLIVTTLLEVISVQLQLGKTKKLKYREQRERGELIYFQSRKNYRM